MSTNEYVQLPSNAESAPESAHFHPDASLGDGGTKRSLQERHLSMIALAGMIGTGLFLSSGQALSQAGPLGCVLGFLLMGSVTAAISLISAEMSAFKPLGGGFVRHATLWIDSSAGIVTGWNFWYAMAITMPAEVSAAVTLLNFWHPTQNVVIPIVLLWLAITAVNLAPVRFYGEFEFYFAFCKVAFIIAFIIAGLLLDSGLFTGGERVGFRYWSPPFPLFREYVLHGWKGRFAGFWSTMISAAFAYGNVQIVAIAGAETRNPRESIPAALKATFTRVVMFYVLSIFVISLLIPADDPRLTLGNGSVTQSPFVIAFSRAGIKGIPSVFNAVVFVWLLSIVTTAGLVSWGIICIAYLRFYYALQRQGISRKRLPYMSPFQPYLAYFALVMNVLVVLTSGWTLFVHDSFSLSGFVYYYFNCLAVPALYGLCKYLRKDSLVRLEDIDIHTELMLIRHEQQKLATTESERDSSESYAL